MRDGPLPEDVLVQVQLPALQERPSDALLTEKPLEPLPAEREPVVDAVGQVNVGDEFAADLVPVLDERIPEVGVHRDARRLDRGAVGRVPATAPGEVQVGAGVHLPGIQDEPDHRVQEGDERFDVVGAVGHQVAPLPRCEGLATDGDLPHPLLLLSVSSRKAERL